MPTPLLLSLSVEELTSSGLWSRLPHETRALAARSLYTFERGGTARREADAMIAHALHFRDVAVKKLPVEKRADYLARVVRPGDSLASTLLLALHLENRRPMLASFLDQLGIPHDDGSIAEGHHPAPPSRELLAQATEHVLERFPEDDVDVYLASLLAMDQDTWAELRGILAERKAEVTGT